LRNTGVDGEQLYGKNTNSMATFLDVQPGNLVDMCEGLRGTFCPYPQ